MTKNWKKTKEGNYSFSVDNKQIGTMEISYASLERKAICNIENNVFIIKRTGFWKSTVEINNQTGQTIAKLYPKKWYANSWTLDFKEKELEVIVRNNPLAEYAIIDNSKELAAYGLTTENGNLTVRVTTLDESSGFLFDFLLWYLFVPIATENMGDSFTFMMLLNIQ
jgi:hypothetical protein